MAEYIEKAEIEKWGTCIAERNNKQELIPKIGIHLLHTADVIERSKINKAIEEMNSIELVMDCDEMRDYCIEILKRNIGD